MSAILNPSPAPAPAPAQIGLPREPSPAPPSRWKWWAALAAVLVTMALGYLALRGKAEQPGAQIAIRTAKVFTGSLDRILRVTGTTEARNFASITVPMMRGPDSGRNLIL